MNPYFIPNSTEELLIQKIHKYCRNEFALIRMTHTMLKKGTFDASDAIRRVLVNYGIADYTHIYQGKKNKLLKKTFLITPYGIDKRTVSYYRPKTKQGDPRFWVYKLHHDVVVGDLVYFTVYENKLITIPLYNNPDFENSLRTFFGTNEEDVKILHELFQKMQGVVTQGWIKSISPTKSYPKDVGDTLEMALGIPVNNLVSADFQGKVEIKAKRRGSKTKDSLFSMVPNWDISHISSATDVMFTHGYTSTKHPGYIDLYVDVRNTPNPQGLFMITDDENEMIHQKCITNGVETDVCSWHYNDVHARLAKKHPKTYWVIADEALINGSIHFKYTQVQLTQNPIFSQFLALVDQGFVIYSWRGKVKPNRTGYDDHGHCFRIAPKNRSLLFGETTDLIF